MQSKATTVTLYLAALPPERRAALEAVRKVIRRNLAPGFKEGMQYGMIGYFLPLARYPAGYHCDPQQPLPMASLASQKNHLALYLMALYMDPALLAWFTAAWKHTGKRLDMGKSCLRFQRVDDLALDVIGELFRRTRLVSFVQQYERCLNRQPISAKSGRANPKSAKSAKVARASAASKTSKPTKAAAKPAPKQAGDTRRTPGRQR